MMICPSCGKEIADGAKFCTKCGIKIVPGNITSAPEAGNNSIDLSDEYQSESPQQSTDINGGKKSFVWQEKYTYMAIAGAIAAAAIIGFAVRISKSPENSSSGTIAYNESGLAEGSDAFANDYIEGADEDEEPDLTDGLYEENGELIEEETEDEDMIENDNMFDDTGIHSYELIVDDVTWTEAYENCLRMGGYLVRVNSDDECEAILRQVSDEDKQNIKFWVGGCRENANEYRWVYNDDYDTRDSMILGDIIINSDEMYSGYWLEGEPSFYDETTGYEENRMNMFYMKSQERWVWNDVPDDILEVADFYAGTIGYICEYE